MPPHIELTNTTSETLPLEKFQQHLCTICEWEGYPSVSLSVAFVDDATIQNLHHQYLGMDTPTDVLSFPLQDEEEDNYLGEVVLSIDTARREAQRRGHSFEAEIMLYLIHGVLHLLGYNDQAEGEREAMEGRQNELLQRLGYPPISGD